LPLKKSSLTIFIFASAIFSLLAQKEEQRVISVLDTLDDGSLMLTQAFVINVPVNKVWEAYTTKEGWESWAVPKAEIDWKINGSIKTNYNPAGEIGDSTTITTHIINYIPEKLITLQAEITKNFPAFMKADEKDFYNIIEFIQTAPSRTKVVSYGLGYKNNQKYHDLLRFFIQGNEQTQLKLIKYLEGSIKT
jgi:uncharacterized protein YndB with AHSA1/START domain